MPARNEAQLRWPKTYDDDDDSYDDDDDSYDDGSGGDDDGNDDNETQLRWP
jgi:hypothetical protein